MMLCILQNKDHFVVINNALSLCTSEMNQIANGGTSIIAYSIWIFIIHNTTAVEAFTLAY